MQTRSMSRRAAALSNESQPAQVEANSSPAAPKVAKVSNSKNNSGNKAPTGRPRGRPKTVKKASDVKESARDKTSESAQVKVDDSEKRNSEVNVGPTDHVESQSSGSTQMPTSQSADNLSPESAHMSINQQTDGQSSESTQIHVSHPPDGQSSASAQIPMSHPSDSQSSESTQMLASHPSDSQSSDSTQMPTSQANMLDESQATKQQHVDSESVAVDKRSDSGWTLELSGPNYSVFMSGSAVEKSRDLNKQDSGRVSDQNRGVKRHSTTGKSDDASEPICKQTANTTDKSRELRDTVTEKMSGVWVFGSARPAARTVPQLSLVPINYGALHTPHNSPAAQFPNGMNNNRSNTQNVAFTGRMNKNGSNNISNQDQSGCRPNVSDSNAGQKARISGENGSNDTANIRSWVGSTEGSEPVSCFKVISYTVGQVERSRDKHVKLLAEILETDADIICLQDLDETYYKELMLWCLILNGYNATFMPYSGTQQTSGSATFYRIDRFNEFNCEKVDLVKLIREDIRKSTNLTRDGSTILQQAVHSPSVVILSGLTCVHTGAELLITNVRLTDRSRRQDVQCIEMKEVLQELTRQLSRFEKARPVLCGNFCADTSSAVYELMSQGRLSASNDQLVKNIKIRVSQNEKISLFSLLWKNIDKENFRCISSYQAKLNKELETKFVGGAESSGLQHSDYIWHSAAGLLTRRVLGPVVSERGSFTRRLANADHIPICSEIEILP